MFNKIKFILFNRFVSSKTQYLRSVANFESIDGRINCRRDANIYDYLDSNNAEAFEVIKNSMKVLNDFVTEEEEESLMKEIEPYIKRLRYESIDAVRFCGDTIAGISLLSSSVMRLVKESDKNVFVDVLLKRRSLYIMAGIARYEFTHEILGQQISRFKGRPVERDRRISVICRNEPNSSHSIDS